MSESHCDIFLRDTLHDLVPFVQFKKREIISLEECHFC